MNLLRIALDWTPNINHIGIFVAQHNGFYSNHGIELSIIDPSADNYNITPAKKVERGMADMALCPTESLISYQTKAEPFPLTGIAALLQNDLSAIAVNTPSITGPAGLDGRTYASYAARYEDGIVKQMITNDGGNGNLTIKYPEKLGIWNTLIEGTCDATWVFLNWEGVEAETFDSPLTYFKMADYDIPYSYSPVIAAGPATIEQQSDTLNNMLRATKKGYQFSIKHPQKAIEILQEHIPEKDSDIDLAKALKQTAPHFGEESDWGQINPEVVQNFLDWIHKHGLEDQQLKAEQLITNKLNP